MKLTLEQRNRIIESMNRIVERSEAVTEETKVNKKYKHIEYTKKQRIKFLAIHETLKQKQLSIDWTNKSKGIDNGIGGDYVESLIKKELNAFHLDNVSSSRRRDLSAYVDGKRKNFEIKTNCGELGTYNVETGLYSSDITPYTIVFYTKDLYPKQELQLSDIYVLSGVEFFGIMLKGRHIRFEKQSTRGNVKTSIQSYRNSIKAEARLAKALSEHITLDDWLKVHEITF